MNYLGAPGITATRLVAPTLLNALSASPPHRPRALGEVTAALRKRLPQTCRGLCL